MSSATCPLRPRARAACARGETGGPGAAASSPCSGRRGHRRVRPHYLPPAPAPLIQISVPVRLPRDGLALYDNLDLGAVSHDGHITIQANDDRFRLPT